MKAKLLGVATALALLGASPAAAITYLISDNAGIPSDPQGFLTGSITTNGTIGTLSSVNIAAWNLNISGHGQLVTYTEFNSHFTLTGSALTATATALSFNYTATLGYSLQFFLDGGTGPGIAWMADGGSRGSFVLSFDPLVGGEVEPRPGIVHILLHQRRFHSQLPSHSLPPASACWDCSAGAGNGALHHYHQDIHDTFRMASRLLELL